jgi:hypothetical protein
VAANRSRLASEGSPLGRARGGRRRFDDGSDELTEPAGAEQAVPYRELRVVAATRVLVAVGRRDLDEGDRRVVGSAESFLDVGDTVLHRSLNCPSVGAVEVGPDCG